VKITAEGATLHVQARGYQDHPVLMLLHAFPLNGAMWAAQIEAFWTKWRVVVPDFRGFGLSEPGDSHYAIDFFVDDLFAVMDNRKLGVEQPVVACGCSMGGYVLLRAVEREPQRFRGLILADTRSTADTDEGKLKRLDAIRAIRKKGVATFAAGFADSALGKTTRKQRPDVVEAVKAMVAPGSAPALIGAQLAMAARTDTTAALPGIGVPTLVIVGEEDALTPPDASQAMVARIPGAKLEVIPGAGHLAPLEAPDAFNAALEGFLQTAALPPL
jgi:pimeloyl-ACP methyl ester carboxylesterase